MKKWKVLFILVVFIISSIIGVHVLLNGDSILVNFDIISLENKNNQFTLKHDLVKAAEYYKIEIKDQDNRKIFTLDTKKTTNNFQLFNLNYDDEYALNVYAYDESGNYRLANKEYLFTWNEPSFINDNIILDDKEYTLNIEGNLEEKDYEIVLKNGEEELLKDKLKDNQMMISENYYVGKKMELKCLILDKDVVIDEITLFNNINPVSDIKITSPSEDVIPYNDITLMFEGGEHASSYMINLYKNENLILSRVTTNKEIVFAKEVFEIGENYQIEVIGNYDKYRKSAKVVFSVSDQEQVKPVYIGNDWNNIEKGTKLELKTHSEDAKIYYTLDGKNPESFGLVYTGPIEINENVVLKTVAVEKGKLNSVIKEYKINVQERRQLKVYLSPSNQIGNLGILEVGYTNERDEMNDLTDYIEERLESHGVKVYRNNSSGNINLWTGDSNYYKVDLHLAIHSNASLDHKAYGIETWIHNENSNTLSLASVMQNNLMAIYPYKDRENANRGVRYANGAFGECNDEYLPFGILLEVAYHDEENDAKWIMENKKLIGYNIADSILEYYQVL